MLELHDGAVEREPELVKEVGGCREQIVGMVSLELRLKAGVLCPEECRQLARW